MTCEHTIYSYNHSVQCIGGERNIIQVRPHEIFLIHMALQIKIDNSTRVFFFVQPNNLANLSIEGFFQYNFGIYL